MKILTKTLKTHALALAVVAAFTFSATAASACDGMKEHAKAGDSKSDETKSQASNDSGKSGVSGAKSKTKAGAGESKSRSEDGANKS